MKHFVMAYLTVCFCICAAAADFDRLTRDLGSDDFTTRERATQALRDSGLPAVHPLFAATHSKDPEVRLRASRVLYETLTPYFFLDELEVAALTVLKNFSVNPIYGWPQDTNFPLLFTAHLQEGRIVKTENLNTELPYCQLWAMVRHVPIADLKQPLVANTKDTFLFRSLGPSYKAGDTTFDCLHVEPETRGLFYPMQPHICCTDKNSRKLRLKSLENVFGGKVKLTGHLKDSVSIEKYVKERVLQTE